MADLSNAHTSKDRVTISNKEARIVFPSKSVFWNEPRENNCCEQCLCELIPLLFVWISMGTCLFYSCRFLLGWLQRGGRRTSLGRHLPWYVLCLCSWQMHGWHNWQGVLLAACRYTGDGIQSSDTHPREIGCLVGKLLGWLVCGWVDWLVSLLVK